MVLVVLLHSGIANIEIGGEEVVAGDLYPIYGLIYYFLSNGLSRVAVPLFFLISSYLFFANISNFDKDTYIKKVKSRTQSLLIPYTVWTFLTFILLCVTKREALLEYSDMQIWDAIWSVFNGHKLNYHLWFLLDLYIVVLLTPVVYILTKYLKWVLPLVLTGIWFAGYTPKILGLDQQTITFFTLGSYLGLSKPSLGISASKCRQFSVSGGGNLYNTNSYRIMLPT